MARFGKPDIRDVAPKAWCVELLKAQADKLDLAGATKKLLAWSPLINLAGENSAPCTAFSIFFHELG